MCKFIFQLLITFNNIYLKRAEEGDEEGYAEVDEEAVEQRQDNIFLTAAAGDDGQGGIHGGGAAGTDGCQPPEPSHHQRGTQQGDDLAQNVGQQGNGTQFWSMVLSDDNA